VLATSHGWRESQFEKATLERTVMIKQVAEHLTVQTTIKNSMVISTKIATTIHKIQSKVKIQFLKIFIFLRLQPV
jgi:aspartyl aminopeptidase